MAECQPGEAICDDRCVSLRDDVLNCGACDVVCAVDHGVPACAEGACTIEACTGTYRDCDGRYENGCETDTANDPAHCGGCDVACTAPHGTALCSAGVCSVVSCNSPHADCNGDAADGCETDLDADVDHCGRCGQACVVANGAGACQDGTCVVTICNDHFDDCNGVAADGCETDLDNDADNCGECGNSCGWTEDPFRYCLEGYCNPCLYAGGDECYMECNNTCTDGAETVVCNNPLACGWCDHHCTAAHGVADCVDVGCEIVSCDTGYDDCDGLYTNGCEADLTNDPAHCGTCDNTCPPGSSCTLGSCS